MVVVYVGGNDTDVWGRGLADHDARAKRAEPVQVAEPDDLVPCGRDIKVGLTAAVIVSQWTWAATLLQSSNVAWQYGVSGPFW